MVGTAWPLWSEKEIDALTLGYLKEIIESRDGAAVFAGDCVCELYGK